MRHLIPSLLFFVLLSFPVQASFQQRAQAMELYKKKQYAEALELFLEIAQTKKDVTQAEALFMAAQIAHRMQNPARAMELAESIRLKPYAQFTKMTLLKTSGSWPELLAVSEEVDATTWPEKLLHPAFIMQAEAYAATENYEAARAAYAQAISWTRSPAEQARTLLAEADVAAKAGASPEEQLRIYERVVALQPKGGGLLQRAHLARAKILADQGQTQAALDEIVPLESGGKKDVYWIVAAAVAKGQIHATTGQPGEAKAAYEKALAIPSAPAELTQQAKDGLRRLEASKN